MRRSDIPTRVVLGVPRLSKAKCQEYAKLAVEAARMYAPKVTGHSAARLLPIAGEGFFGIEWLDDYVWYQEMGIRPFTMRSLAGKTIPMWVNDPDGSTAAKQKNPRTRTLPDGRRQTLIFRRAAEHGRRKDVLRQTGNGIERVSVPMSYPGAPGRIAVNRSRGILRVGDTIGAHRNRGAIARSNVGVRWRHPGLDPGRFMARGVEEAARAVGISPKGIEYLSELEMNARNYRVVIARG